MIKFVLPARFTDPKVLLGNQQQLMQLISCGELDMAGLNDYTAKELNEILVKVGIERRELRKYCLPELLCYLSLSSSRLSSNMAKRDVLMSLYKSVESGYSQCHHTGNRKKASGGW